MNSSHPQPEGRVIKNVVEIRLKRGESVDKALRRLKKKMDKEGTMKEIRNHRYFDKPSEKRRKKRARSRSF
ncbi:MAG: 30S ribosomal protein S21 [Kiritimatiellia bacterium]|jgi:small subunit ribosomal protein S21